MLISHEKEVVQDRQTVDHFVPSAVNNHYSTAERKIQKVLVWCSDDDVRGSEEKRREKGVCNEPT